MERGGNRSRRAKRPLILSPLAAGSPQPRKPGQYLLVFNGKMGQEEAAPGESVGAVAGRLVQDPLEVRFMGVQFVVAPPNQFEPAPLYYLDAFLARNDELIAIIKTAGKRIRFVLNGKSYPCITWSTAGIFCASDTYPWTQMTLNANGDGGAYGLPYFSLDNMAAPTGTAIFFIDDAPLLQFTFAPQAVSDLSPVSFKDVFHFKAN